MKHLLSIACGIIIGVCNVASATVVTSVHLSGDTGISRGATCNPVVGQSFSGSSESQKTSVYSINLSTEQLDLLKSTSISSLKVGISIEATLATTGTGSATGRVNLKVLNSTGTSLGTTSSVVVNGTNRISLEIPAAIRTRLSTVSTVIVTLSSNPNCTPGEYGSASVVLSTNDPVMVY